MGVNTAMEDVRMVCVCAHELEEGGRDSVCTVHGGITKEILQMRGGK